MNLEKTAWLVKGIKKRQIAFMAFGFSAVMYLSTAQSQQPYTINDTEVSRPQFGMWLRDMPEQASAIYAPTVVQHAPTNEATMLYLGGDTLKTFYVNRPGDGDKMMSVQSVDGGLTWGDPVIEFDLPGVAYYANRVIKDAKGRLHCVFHISATGNQGRNGRHYDLWHCHTGTDGRSWSKPVRLFAGYVGSLRTFMQLRSGRLLLSFAKAIPERVAKPAAGQTDYGWHDVISMYSDDNGLTWKPSGNSIRVVVDANWVTRYGAIEPSVIELADGRLWMLMRTNKGCLYESYSADGGTSWSSPEATEFVSSDSPAELVRLSDGKILLLWNANQRWDDPRSYAAGGREVLHAAISRDEGKTWTGFREVLTVPSGSDPNERGDKGTAYASAAETASGKVAIVSGQGESKAIVLMDPAWLEEKEVAADFSQGLVQWTLYGADSLVRLTRMSATGRDGLLIRQSAGRPMSNAEAVWNFPAVQAGTLELDVEAHTGSRGVSIALTDHFSISGDTEAADHAIARFVLDSARYPEWFADGLRTKLSIYWDSHDQEASLYIGSQLVERKKFNRKTPIGLNYLRLGIPNGDADPAGFTLHSVRMAGKDKKTVVVAFGNSTTAPRKGVEKVYPVRLEEMLGGDATNRIHLINAGKPGSHSGSVVDNCRHKIAHALDRLDTAVLRHQPAVVIVCFGINDAWVDAALPSPSRIPLDEYRRNLSTMIDKIQARRSKVVLMTPNPIGGKYAAWRAERLEQYVDVVRQLAEERTLPLADTWALFHEKSTGLPGGVDELLLDGMHPNDKGQTIMAEALAAIIKLMDLHS